MHWVTLVWSSTRCSRRRQTSPPVLPSGDLVQTPFSAVRLVPTSGEAKLSKYTRRLWFWPIPSNKHYVKTLRHPQNRNCITYRTAVRGGPSLSATGNTCSKFGYIRNVWFLRYASGHTDKPTDIQRCWSHYFRTSQFGRTTTKGEVSRLYRYTV